MLHYLRAMAILVAIRLARMIYILTQSQEFSAAVALSPTSAAPGTAAPTQPAVSTPATPPPSAPGSGADAPLPQGVHVAGSETGGMRPSAVQARLVATLAPLLHPLDLRVETARSMLRPEDIGMHIPLDARIAKAQSAPTGAQIALRVSYDAARLRSVLEDLARRTDRQATVVVISDTVPLSRSFAIAPGQRLDVAMREVDARLQLLSARPQLALLRQADLRMPHPLPGQLQAQIAALARE